MENKDQIKNIDTEKLWNGVLEALKTEVSEGAFNTYLRNTHPIGVQAVGEKLIFEVGCNSTFIKNTIEARYLGQINRELERISEKKSETTIKVAEKAVKEQNLPGPLFEGKKAVNYQGIIKRANLRDDFSFETYAVSGSNQMAYAAATAVAKNPGPTYNPLFIYGGVGVGKTHLMQAVGHEVIKKGENEVLFCSGEEFTNDLVEAIRFKSTDKVRAKYRKVKLLMIDDVQFIAGKSTVQEEFFHTFNSIQREGGQVIMTSDKPPAEIPKLEERLRSRFGAGLTVDIGPADFELRTAILLIKAKQRGYEMAMDTAQIIAANIEGVRELQGFLVRMETEEKVRGRKLENNEVREMLNMASTESVRSKVITPTEVINAVSDFYQVGVQQLKGERRTKTVAWPRQILMFLLRNDLRLPLEEVGRLLGGRDHTTVMHASEKVKVEMEENLAFAAEIAEVKRKIFNSY
jgi:chromosomal replication initiator protein